MLKIFYSFLLTTTLTYCKAQTPEEFQQNINEMKQFKAILADDDDVDSINNTLMVDITEGIKKVKINEKTVDSLGFKTVLTNFLTANKNKKSLLIAGSFDHAKMENIVVFTRLFHQLKLLFDPNNQSKICFKSFKDLNAFKFKTANLNSND